MCKSRSLLPIVATLLLVAVPSGQCENKTLEGGKKEIELPGFWPTLGCFVGEDDVEGCIKERISEATDSKDESKKTSSEKDEDFFDSISKFFQEGIVKFFDGDDDKDKKGDPNNEVASNPEDDSDEDDDSDYDKDSDEEKDSEEKDSEESDEKDSEEKDSEEKEYGDDYDYKEVNVEDNTTPPLESRKKRDVSVKERGSNGGLGSRKKNKGGMSQLIDLGILMKEKVQTYSSILDNIMEFKQLLVSVATLVVGMASLYYQYKNGKDSSQQHKVIYHAEPETNHHTGYKGWSDDWNYKRYDKALKADAHDLAFKAQAPQI